MDVLNIESLFQEFINDSAKNDKDIYYSLIQSSVEPIIRFKFGSWLHENYGDHLTMNLLETNRIDLIIGIDNELILIEFGHLLNLLKHNGNLNKEKIEADTIKIKEKKDKFLSKLNKKKPDFLKNHIVKYYTCSLFSEFILAKKKSQYRPVIQNESLKSGTLFKYGVSFNHHPYFEKYSKSLNQTDHDEHFMYDFKRVEIIPEELYLHYKFIEHSDFLISNKR